jgi:serine/threonine-protein kinase
MRSDDMTMPSVTCSGCRHAFAATALYCPNCGRAKDHPQSATDPLVGKLLGERFQVQELIGQGGSGTIYRAEHVTLRRRVAIKVLHDELSRDDLAVERFRREATTVAEIDNEHIVEIHDFGRTPDGRLYLAMELLEGETLDGVLAREKTLSVEKTADILIQVGEALMEAHAIGYVHRDLRPRNIYLAVRRGKANFVKLLDFGLAKLVESDAQAASTSLGMTFGDPRYMSPEQARGDRIDRRADIYQLGCVAYEMLTSAPPFTGNRVFDILTKQVTDIPTPLPTRRPGVPLWMEAAVAKMLAKSPEDRFATTTRMVEALRRGLDTGEVMEDDIARRRESIPPPSVSRVMQRFGVTTPQDLPVVPPTSPPPPVAAAPTVQVEDVRRKRTGTPQVGVPAMPAPPPARVKAPTAPPQAPVEVQKPIVATDAPSGRVRAPTGPDPMGISQAWYDDGDRESGEAEKAEKPIARKAKTASVTDLSIFDEPARRSSRGLWLGAAGMLAVGAVVVFAMTRGEGDKKAAPPSTPQPPPVAAEVTRPPDVAPSKIIEPPSPTPAQPPVKQPVVAKKDRDRDRDPVRVEPKTRPVADVRDMDDPARRRPGGLETKAPVVQPDPPKPPVVVVTPPVDKDKTKGVSGNPVDPYDTGKTTEPTPDPGETAPPGKKAEFYANLGQQQLASGDIANAAASFKKATELDPKNATAVIGLGEIALRQGSFGDAIAHLKKAAKLAPKSSRVFTLLGEAYLNSGQHAQAAEQFKAALKLDPDNARAREGYEEASKRVPPPGDD